MNPKDVEAKLIEVVQETKDSGWRSQMNNLSWATLRDLSSKDSPVAIGMIWQHTNGNHT